MEEDHENKKQNKILAFKEQQQERKTSKFKKIVSIVLVVCIALALWVCRKQLVNDILYERFQIMYAKLSSGEGYPYSLQGNSVLKNNFAVSRKCAAVLSDTSLNVISPKGKVIISAQHSYVSPALASSSARFLIYDLGNKKYRIESINSLVREVETENKILAASIADSGKYAIATFSENYASELKVFTPEGNLQYEYSFATGYITSMDINESGKKGVVCVTFSKNGKLMSAIYLFDFEKTTPVAVYEYDETLFVSSEYSGEKVVCVGDDRFVFLKDKTAEKNEVNLEGALLKAFDLYKGSLIAVHDTYLGASENRIIVYSNKGDIKVSLEIDQKITDAAIFGNTFAVLTNGSVLAYDVDTREFIGEYKVGSDAIGIELYSAEELYVLCFSEITMLKIG